MDNSLETPKGLVNREFKGFHPVKDLHDNRGKFQPPPRKGVCPPPRKGVYLVIWKRHEHNWKDLSEIFLDRGTWRNYENLHTSTSILKDQWVKDALIIYVGANKVKQNGTLIGRIKQLIEFGCGTGDGHRGGRDMWQIKNADNNLQVCWKTVEDDKQWDERKQILGKFKQTHKFLPFANRNN